MLSGMSRKLASVNLPNVTALYCEIGAREKLGPGTTAVVYKARWRGRDIALKEFTKGPDDPGDDWKRAVEEIDICRSLKHPQIVPYVFGGIVDIAGRRKVVLATRYCAGVTLHDVIESNIKSEAKRIDLARDVLDFSVKVIGYLHGKGIVHRDFKPENIILGDGKSSKLRLIDFGLARRLGRQEELPSSWKINAASRFRSPEKWKKFTNTNEKDELWSVGVIMFRILNGRYPFEAEGSESKLGEVVRYNPPAQPGFGRRTAIMNRYVAWLLRKDEEFRPSVRTVRRSAADKGADQLGADLSIISGGIKQLAPVGKKIADRLAAWTEAGTGLRVEPLCERAAAVDAWLDRGEKLRFFDRAVPWLTGQRLRNGGFPSISTGRKLASTYCTAMALMAFVRSRKVLAGGPHEPEIERLIAETRETLVRARQAKGWSWFLTAGPADPIASHWAALALAEAGMPLPLQEILPQSLASAKDCVLNLRARDSARVALSMFCTARLQELGYSTIPIERAFNESCRIFFAHTLRRGRIHPVDNLGVRIPLKLRGGSPQIESIPWYHHTSALLSYAYFSASAQNPFLLDAGLRLVIERLGYKELPEIDPSGWAWSSIALSPLPNTLSPLDVRAHLQLEIVTETLGR